MKKRADGRWQKQKMINGEKIFFYSSEKTEKAAIRDIENQMLAYTSGLKKGPLFNRVADLWWEIAEKNISYQTTKSYGASLKRAQEHFQKKHIKDMTVKEINAFLADMGREGFAHKTVANQKSVLSLIFEHAVSLGILEYNICRSVTLPKGLKRVERPPASEHDELLSMAAADDFLFPFISIYTGMRKGEILALQWKDIDFENNIIFVTKSIEHVSNVPRIKPPKTKAGNRMVPLLAPVKEKFLQISPRWPDDFIISEDGGASPLTATKFRCMIKRFQKATGATCTSHQLRHSYATIAVENDLNAKSLQSVLGHKQISTTLNTYAAFRKKGLEKATEQLNSIFADKFSQKQVKEEE